jgi:hypothetical protein
MKSMVLFTGSILFYGDQFMYRAFLRFGLRATFVGSLACLLVFSGTGFRFSEKGSEKTDAEVFDAELQRVQADVRTASVSDGPASAAAVERVATTLQGIDGFPFYKVLRADARGGSEERLVALGALGELRSLSAELLDSSSLDDGGKKSALDLADKLVRRVREQVYTLEEANRRTLRILVAMAVTILACWQIISPVGSTTRKDKPNRSRSQAMAA